jgi:hypothetical protein
MGNPLLRVLLASSVVLNQAFPASLPQAKSEVASSAQDVTLTASIEKSTEHGSLLHLSLKNVGTSPETVVTGVKTGNADYPAASFNFMVKFRDGHLSTLWCSSCEPGLIAGTGGFYIVTLAADKSFDTAIPLADLRLDADHSLCTPETEGALLIVTLDGSLWGADGSDAPRSPAIHRGYWQGKASDTVVLVCNAADLH